MRTQVKRGFTLIEILIVVVILGILAAIVIPQFTSASEEAKGSSVQSQLQTVRSQIELFNMKEGAYPDFQTNGWNEMTNPMDFELLATTPYLQGAPRNASRRNATGIIVGTAVAGAASGAGAATGEADDKGWYWNTDRKIMYAIDADGNILDW